MALASVLADHCYYSSSLKEKYFGASKRQLSNRKRGRRKFDEHKLSVVEGKNENDIEIIDSVQVNETQPDIRVIEIPHDRKFTEVQTHELKQKWEVYEQVAAVFKGHKGNNTETDCSHKNS